MCQYPKIALENVCFSYEKRTILKGISLQFPEQAIIAVTGPSGTGKSTFLSLFNRLWEEEGQGNLQGKITIHFKEGPTDIYGKEIALDQLRRRVGMVFQSPNPLPMSIGRNIAFPLGLQGKMSRVEKASRVEKILQEVHLWDEVKDRLDSDARTLSGGQQQRLCIARALILQPEILLLDEPTSSLDAAACEKIELLLVELKRQCTILMVSHYQDQIQRIADLSYRLANKRLERQ
ncbi:phosphate ABC transporter ATP-binding protein [Desulfotalea psychrophila]|uniref:Probable phosphate ABC-transporter, ATP binding protein n=1 Tax=Desulfotalea psychrophila (strain LSv54 / DSM 12343) TaxID=177439 RepID=Q6ANW6_DESPS|nr:phosphate ABC transporter ATP-binding protein [Desulfotalea psychrophila]CAG35958.1 probable phosphate ABC-transporter, ATP binding protein [Desulfotalea psychrophila LSv54]